MPRFAHNDIITLVADTRAPRYDLAETVGPDLHLSDLVDEATFAAELRNLPLAYGHAAGHPQLRQAIADRYRVGPDEVVTAVGGVNAIFLAGMAACDPGDEVVLAVPAFPPIEATLRAIGAEVRTLRLKFETGYQVDPSEVLRLVSGRTKMVFLTSPQTPSGVAVPYDIQREVSQALARHNPDACLLVDETYKAAAYGDEAVAPSAVDIGSNVVALTSLSKCHGAPGLRLGWLVTRNRVLRNQLVTAKFNTVISCSPLDEALAVRLLQKENSIVRERRRILAQGLARVAAWASDNRPYIGWLRPSAGALCCARLRPESFDEAAVDRFHQVIAANGVRVGLGAWFGDEARIFRIGFGLLSMPDLEAALGVLSAALRQIAAAA
ncbi:MAG: pyridoxal phosphate-dependent aminotransferase [Steroidobacteraceae bacterium]